MKTSSTGLLFSLCLLLSLTTLSSSGQAQEEQRWYKVELLIFSHGVNAGEEKEKWDPNPQLLYPSRYRFLLDPKRIAANEAEFEGTSTLDDFGRQTLTITDPMPSLPEAIDPNQPEPELIEDIQRPTPFILLPRSELAFGSKALQMQRSGRYQTLFHESWVQPMVNKLSTRPIVVDHSGDELQWPRLQGSVKFYLSRYLHLETNLWLNTNGSYFPPGWQMPEAPLGPASLALVYPEAEVTEVVDETLLFEPANLQPTTGEEFVTNEETEKADTPPVYPWGHAILLQQKRRMRSTEVHYLDHPLLGVVVQITPVDEEELLHRATDEAQQKAAQARLKLESDST